MNEPNRTWRQRNPDYYKEWCALNLPDKKNIVEVRELSLIRERVKDAELHRAVFLDCESSGDNWF